VTLLRWKWNLKGDMACPLSLMHFTFPLIIRLRRCALLSELSRAPIVWLKLRRCAVPFCPLAYASVYSSFDKSCVHCLLDFLSEFTGDMHL
jgi:hypothetical protein